MYLLLCMGLEPLTQCQPICSGCAIVVWPLLRVLIRFLVVHTIRFRLTDASWLSKLRVLLSHPVCLRRENKCSSSSSAAMVKLPLPPALF